MKFYDDIGLKYIHERCDGKYKILYSSNQVEWNEKSLKSDPLHVIVLTVHYQPKYLHQNFTDGKW